MTGRDLIIYILQNNLEDVSILDPNIFMTASEAAVKLGVGVATVRAWYDTGMVSGFILGDELYVFTSGPIVISRN